MIIHRKNDPKGRICSGCELKSEMYDECEKLPSPLESVIGESPTTIVASRRGFASLKSQRDRDRSRHYGIENCLAEMYWEAMGHNLLKLSRKLY